MRKKARRTGLFLAVSLFAFAGPVLSDDKGITEKDLAALEEAREIYDDNCAACHGYDGVPLIPGIPSFAKGERMEKSDAELLNSVKKGSKVVVEGEEIEMPPWEGELSDAELKQALGLVRVLEGDKVFQDKCSSCHGETGVPRLPSSIPEDMKTLISHAGPLKVCSDFDAESAMERNEIVKVIKFLRNLPKGN